MINFLLKNKSAILLVILSVVLFSWFKNCTGLKHQLEQKNSYISALEDNQRGKVTELAMTRSQLQASRDSINSLISDLIKEKGYSKTIVRVERVASTFTKTDSVFFRDTLFIPGLKFDTVISNSNYYSCKISGEYPSSLVITPQVNSDLYLFTHTEKEYVNPRSKIFFIRWFQKKRKIYVTDVEDRNPYIDIKSSRVIQIVE